MSTRLKKHSIIGNIEGDKKNNHWPHPINQQFNEDVRSVTMIYGSGSPIDQDLMTRVRTYLLSRIEGIKQHKIKRDTEQYYQAMNLEMHHGYGKSPEERQNIIEKASILIFAGNWQDYPPCIEDYSFANLYHKPRYEMRHNPRIPVSNIIRYLSPVRPIGDSYWDNSKKDNILVYETKEGLLELLDGNHRHEFAQRLGSVENLSGWIIKEI